MATAISNEVRPAACADDTSTSATNADVSGDKLTLVNGIAGRCMQLSTTAIEAIGLIVERFEIGQQRYGDPDDDRDWSLELEEEWLDVPAYSALLRVVRRRKAARIKAVAEQARSRRVTPNVIHIPPRPELPEPRSSFVVEDGVVSEVLR